MAPNKWDLRFVDMAVQVALWSKDPKKKVGCVIVSPDRRLIATGYNGFPHGIEDDDRLRDADAKNRLVIHAELNALLNARTDLRGWTAHCTENPCQHCALALVQGRIARLVVPVFKTESKWLWEQQEGRRLLHEAGVEVTEFPRARLEALHEFG